MNVGDTYTDADGTHRVDAVDADGNATCVVLVEPSAAWTASLPAHTPPPDYNQAMTDAMNALEALQADSANALLKIRPMFGTAMSATSPNGPIAWGQLEAALAKGELSQAQHDAIANALTANHIPTS